MFDILGVARVWRCRYNPSSETEKKAEMRVKIQSLLGSGYKFSGGVYTTFSRDDHICVTDDNNALVDLDHFKMFPEYYEITYLDETMKILRVDGPTAEFITVQAFLEYLRDEYSSCEHPADFEEVYEEDIYQFFKVEGDNITRIDAEDITVFWTPVFEFK